MMTMSHQKKKKEEQQQQQRDRNYKNEWNGNSRVENTMIEMKSPLKRLNRGFELAEESMILKTGWYRCSMQITER